ncbi:MAG: NUDIX domain-containing protein [Proteobacteria bacterium]|nr:NUDIX domain-containing protein [Pseudomonadota bacterium]
MLQLLWKIKNKLLQLFSFKTVGARALLIQEEKILLVKHTYHRHWYIVGGTVDKGESTLETLRRELQEEVGAILLETPQLLGVYHNTYEKRDDYVAVYVAKHFKIETQEKLSPEIAEIKWFLLNALPTDISPGSQRRITEYLEMKIPSDKW